MKDENRPGAFFILHPSSFILYLASMVDPRLKYPILLSILAALLTIGLKAAAYLLTHSVGLLSDAVESGVNLVAALTAYLSLHYAAKPVDGRRLTYYRAWAALRRLAVYGRWLCAGPASTGAKPSAARRLSPSHLRDLCRYFERFTGTRVRLRCERMKDEG